MVTHLCNGLLRLTKEWDSLGPVRSYADLGAKIQLTSTHITECPALSSSLCWACGKSACSALSSLVQILLSGLAHSCLLNGFLSRSIIPPITEAKGSETKTSTNLKWMRRSELPLREGS